jgi:hypothetical protein
MHKAASIIVPGERIILNVEGLEPKALLRILSASTTGAGAFFTVIWTLLRAWSSLIRS